MQPPTDNLYKFLAIFGLIVVGFSIYIPLQRLEAYSRSALLLKAEYEPLFERLRIVDDRARAELDCAIDNAKAREKQLPKPACPEVAAMKTAADVASAEVSTLRDKLRVLEVERHFLYQQYVIYSVIGIVLGCVGLALCIAGFWLWYVRHQRYLDAAVRKEAGSRRWIPPNRRK